MKARSPTSSLKPAGQAKNGVIPAHLNIQFHTQESAEQWYWHCFGITKAALWHYTPKGTSNTSAWHCDLHRNHAIPAIRSKHLGLQTSGVSQHDSARPHTACVTVKMTRTYICQCSPHPPYLPDFGPCDYYIGPEALSWNTFQSNEHMEKVQTACSWVTMDATTGV
jgi:hypothetical protein